MSTPDSDHKAAGPTLRHPAARAALRRVPGMAAVWCAFGVAIGMLTAPGEDAVAETAGALAGAFVLTPLGVVLVLVGGRPAGSLAGGLLGLAAVPVITWLGGPRPSGFLAACALLSGGLVGATAVTYLFHLPRLLLDRARRAGSAAPPAE